MEEHQLMQFTFISLNIKSHIIYIDCVQVFYWLYSCNQHIIPRRYMYRVGLALHLTVIFSFFRYGKRTLPS